MKRVKEQIEWDARMAIGLNTYPGCAAILDTGISKHPDLAGNIIRFVDLRNKREATYDDNGHGTHVAGCLAGTGALSYGLYSGIAPGTSIIALKILDEKGDGDICHLVEGLTWIIEHAKEYRIRVVNISIGMQKNSNPEGVAEAMALMEKLWDMGLVVICAAGNLGPRVGSLSGLGVGDKVITVGCHEGGYFGKRRGLCEYYSGRGYGIGNRIKPDLVAPGTKIYACNYKYNTDPMHERPYVAKTGTSMSAPIVAGAAVLLFAKYPKISNEQVKDKLMKSTNYVSTSMLEQGHGMINLRKLLYE